MRLVTTSLIAAAAIGTAFSAMAADKLGRFPAYRAPDAVAPYYDWTGFYFGGNIGYSWGTANTDGGIAPGGIYPTILFSEKLKPDGIIGGGQIGYNWQINPKWVFGVEADWQGSGQKNGGGRDTDFSYTISNGLNDVDVAGTNTTTLDAKLKWFGTLRGRLGFAWSNWLLYGTGGLAYGKVGITGASSSEGTICDPTGTCPGVNPFLPFDNALAFGQSKTKMGWTLGGGLEGAFRTSNWSWKAEYLYIDFGKVNFSQSVIMTGNVDGVPFSTSVPVTGSTRVTDHIVRLGLNYRFGGP